MQDAKCKICRRRGEKLFLKGEKCLSPKCLMIKKAYAPGQKAKRRRGALSEYGKELAEKQKLKNWYNLSERQLHRYAKEGSPEALMRKLESRLDNVVFRLGFASSRPQARQLVSHRHFSVNKIAVNIPSYQVEKGDVIEPRSKKVSILNKKHKPPKWLKLDAKNLKGEVTGAPTLEEAAPPVEISAIFEYYSR